MDSHSDIAEDALKIWAASLPKLYFQKVCANEDLLFQSPMRCFHRDSHTINYKSVDVNDNKMPGPDTDNTNNAICTVENGK